MIWSDDDPREVTLSAVLWFVGKLILAMIGIVAFVIGVLSL